MEVFKRLSRHFVIQDLVAVSTWFVVFGIVLVMLQNADEAILDNRYLIYTFFIGYLASYFIATRTFSGRIPLGGQRVAYVLQLAFAFGLMLLVPADFLPILTIIWVGVSMRYLRPRVAFIVTTVVVIAWFSLLGYVWDVRHVAYAGALYYAFHLFALMMSVQTVKAEQASEQAKQLNVELLATRELLAESSKVQERTRIARELHDLLGHHLTALNINLQVAEHLVAERPDNGALSDSISQSYLLSKLLLSDVREAVSTIREHSQLDISAALMHMEAAFPNLSITLDIQEMKWDNMEFAHDVLRCIQEAATNAVKHGNATHLFVRIAKMEHDIEITIRDNGRTQPGFTQGNGMTGMKERMTTYKGAVTFDTSNRSMAVQILVPFLHAGVGDAYGR